MNTLFTGRKIIDLPETGSTNTYASELLRTMVLPEGTVVRAHAQISGRGQQGNKWLSEPGMNLTLSFIYYPGFLAVKDQFMLSKAVSLAIADVLELSIDEKLHEGIRIKWPNDIYLNQKKIGGILIENTIRDNRIASTIIGIGLNVNQTAFGAELKNVCSMRSVAEKEFDLKRVSNQLFMCMEARYLQLRSGRFEILDEPYLEKLFRINENSRFQFDGITKEGKITGVDTDGKLRIEFSTGEMRSFGMKEISFCE